MKGRRVLAACSVVSVVIFAACNFGESSKSGGPAGNEDPVPGDPSGESGEATILGGVAIRGENDPVDIVVYDNDDPANAGAGEGSNALSLTPGESPPIVLYLNKNGATVSKGTNDSAANTSQIVTSTTVFPPSSYQNDPTRWAEVVAGVKNHFARYNVTIVETEPTTGTYLEAIVTSGSPSLIGYGDNLGGIAPTRCGIVAKSIAFIFDHGGRRPLGTAEVISHELGHSLSLSHTQTQSDLMSYTSQTPLKFEDLAATCGTAPGKTEACNCQGTTQNNHQQLIQYVGAVQSTTPPPADAGSPTDPPPPDAGTPPPTTTESVAILSPANNSTYTPNTTVEVKADFSKVTGLQKGVLHWRINTQVNEYPCPSSSCTVANGIYTWRIVPGGGERIFYARATKTSGAVIDSPSVRIGSATTTTDAGTAPPPSTDPAVFCVDEINRYRAQAGKPALAGWSAAQSCTATQCQNDYANKKDYGSFGACGELAQTQCAGWRGWRGDPTTVMKDCLGMMWSQNGSHKSTMTSTQYTKVACNYYKASNGDVTAIQNYR